MIRELVLFAVFLGLGTLFRIIYKLLSAAEKKIGSKTATVIIDILLAALAVGSVVTVAFLGNNGIILPYMIIAIIIGFVLVSLFF